MECSFRFIVMKGFAEINEKKNIYGVT